MPGAPAGIPGTASPRAMWILPWEWGVTAWLNKFWPAFVDYTTINKFTIPERDGKDWPVWEIGESWWRLGARALVSVRLQEVHHVFGKQIPELSFVEQESMCGEGNRVRESVRKVGGDQLQLNAFRI